jgi:PAS domain S-box-containing protein
MPSDSVSTILNVDDSDAQRYATSRVLRHAGFDVIEAGTGQHALAMVGRRPDLVILDVNLPDMSGFDVCRQIRADESNARVPVVHLSASMVSTKARVTGLEGGADAYLVQPVEPEELLATVRALLRVRRAEETLWKSELQYRLFFEANPLACWILDGATDAILAVNEAAVQMYGYARSEFMNLTSRDLLRETANDGNINAATISQQAQVTIVQKHKKKDGQLLDVEILWAPLQIAGKSARLAIVQDITDKLMRESAQREEEVRRLLLEKVLQAQEEERRRIARELHDEAGQLMTSLLIGLRAINDAQRLTLVKQQTKRLRKITSDTITELGRMARGLHSGILEDLGLLEALKRLVDDFASAHKIRVDFDFGTPGFQTTQSNGQLGVYRIVQEALTNIARHSKAKNVSILFVWKEPKLRLTIHDDGVGFEMKNLLRNPSDHLGIEGMRQRALMLGGTLEIASQLRKGTQIAVSLPLTSLRTTNA